MIEQLVAHYTYASKAEVPFKHLDILGRGCYGIVDKVERISSLSDSPSSEVYVRKIIYTRRHRTARQQGRILSEVRIVGRLKHPHIVELVETYEVGLKFGIIMSLLADTDLEVPCSCARGLEHIYYQMSGEMDGLSY
jgi:serine/threonine protein kinase